MSPQQVNVIAVAAQIQSQPFCNNGSTKPSFNYTFFYIRFFFAILLIAITYCHVVFSSGSSCMFSYHYLYIFTLTMHFTKDLLVFDVSICVLLNKALSLNLLLSLTVHVMFYLCTAETKSVKHNTGIPPVNAFSSN